MPIFSIQLQPVHVNHSKSNNDLTQVNHSVLTIIWLKVCVYAFNSTNSAVQWGQPGPSNLVKPVSPTALKWHSSHKKRMKQVIYKQSLLMLLLSLSPVLASNSVLVTAVGTVLLLTTYQLSTNLSSVTCRTLNLIAKKLVTVLCSRLFVWLNKIKIKQSPALKSASPAVCTHDNNTWLLVLLCTPTVTVFDYLYGAHPIWCERT